MTKPYDIVVLGSINIDWMVKDPLAFAFTDLSVNGTIARGTIEELPGGSGLNFAQFAQAAGYRTLLVGKVGDDAAGWYIRQWCQTQNLEERITMSPARSTGKAFMVHDKNAIRLLVADHANANVDLTISDIDELTQEISSSLILYVSGYSFARRDAPRMEATLQAIKIAASGDTPTIVFDVVPHTFYTIYTFPEFLDLTKDIDILISEVPTMRRFLSLGDRHEIITKRLAEETAEKLAEFYKRFILRYGVIGLEEEIIYNLADNRKHFRTTGEILDRRGFGDRLTLSALNEIFHLNPRPF